MDKARGGGGGGGRQSSNAPVLLWGPPLQIFKLTWKEKGN